MSFLIQKDISLAEFTTLKIGGKARFFVSAKSESEIVRSLNFAERNNLKIFILGGGSNVLIADEGFDGLVLQISLRGIITLQEKDESVYIEAKAGENWDDFVSFCVEKNLQGIECLSGIPGFVGGTPVQNVGAYGQEVSETIVSVRVYERKTKRIKKLSNTECGFAYRTSIFNTIQKDQYIVLAVVYALKYGGKPKIIYRDLINYFEHRKPDLSETREATLKIRAEKSMVINSQDPNSQSAGSFFKNPIVTAEKLADIVEQARKINIDSVPSFVVDEQAVKIPAAWLIEKSGFQKGYRKGSVGLSTNHTLAIVNFGGAKATDVFALKNEIQAKIKEIFDVELLPEPVFIGF